jgi:hypothetical protein
VGTGVLSLGVKHLGCKVDHSEKEKKKGEVSYTSAASICFHGVARAPLPLFGFMIVTPISYAVRRKQTQYLQTTAVSTLTRHLNCVTQRLNTPIRICITDEIASSR